MSSSLGNGYIGADVNFINDATQEALDDKANLDGGNTFTGNQNLNAGNIVIQASGGHNLQTPQIVGNSELYMRTLGNANIRLEPAGTGETTSTKDINLSTGKEYRVNGTNILTGYATTAYVDAEDAKKANKDGGNTLTGNQNLNAGNLVIQASGGHNLQTPQIVGNSELYMRTLGNANIRLEPAGTGEITGTKDINLSAGKAYKVNGVNILNNIPTNSNVVLLTGDQDVNGIKSFKSNIKADSNLLVNTDAGLIKFGSLGDRQIARTADGISTNGTMSATQYKVNNIQISSSNLSNDANLVKTTGNQTLTGKTINADNNTISNIKNAQIGSNAGIVYSKLNIADGDLTIAKTNGLQSALDGKASDTAVVKLTGNQDVNGIKSFKSDVKADSNLLINTDNGLIKFGSLGDFQFARIADGISTNGKINAVQYKVGGAPLTSSHLLDGATLVKESGIQTLTLKTIDADDNTITNIKNDEIGSNAGIVYSKLNIADGDLTIAKTNGLQSALDSKADDNAVVKLSGTQSVAGAKTFSDKMVVNNETNLNGVFKHTFNASTNVGIQLDNNNTNQWALNATTQNYGWRFNGENTSGNTSDVFVIQTKKGGTTHKVFGINNNDAISLIGDTTLTGDLEVSGIATIQGQLNANSVLKHTFNSSTNVGIQLDNNNVNQYALNATTLGYGWRWRGEATNGADSDLFDVRTKKGGTSHKVFNVSNADIIRMIGNVRIDTTGTKLNLAGLPTSNVGLSTGDVYNDGGILKIA